MTQKKRKDFCTECRKETEYYLQKKSIAQTIREKEYTFEITAAVCAECGEEMNLPGLMDQNAQEIDTQYRAAEGLVTIGDIEKLLKIYKIGKAPLSLVLGFGEVTVTRYLEGQVPSKEYSNIIKSALVSPEFMKKKLSENRERITDAAYKKAETAANSLAGLFLLSEKMAGTIAYVVDELKEVTPLMLQKLLYFVQGISYGLYGSPVFEEDCIAWLQGPAFPKVYDFLKDFKFDLADDARFALLEGRVDVLAEKERRAVNLVVNTFGMYGEKILEKIACGEEPWKNAWGKNKTGFGECIPSGVLIPKSSIMLYYERVNEKYGIKTEDGINSYIHDMLKQNPMQKQETGGNFE